MGGADLGPTTYLFTPEMDQADIQATLDAVATQQLTNQFGTERYALLFAPGTYGSTEHPLNFQVGYYTDVAGLGQQPGDVHIVGTADVYNQCDSSGSCVALNNFWRSLSNLTIDAAGKGGCQSGEFWAVSQGASMRRVQVNGAMTLMDYCTGPSFASGGFIADSGFSSQVVSGSQQQFLTRNSKVGGWSNGVWNQVFVGVQGAPAESTDSSYTTVATAPVEQEKPYPYLDADGHLAVYVPSPASDTAGTSWSDTVPTPGAGRPISGFFVAHPTDTAATINAALSAGQDLLLTPGVYSLDQPIRVTHADTVVLGLGQPTLVPSAGNEALVVSGVTGVRVAGLIVDAGPVRSPSLVTLEPVSPAAADPAHPTLLADVYVRVGGATPGQVRRAVDVLASDAVLDNLWIWRADHGTGVSWSHTAAPYGLRVLGKRVTAYGLFVEHFKRDQATWNGADGRLYMFQSEMPYDPPSQAAWGDGAFLGHASLVVKPAAKGFRGFGLGSYSFFNQGKDIHATQGFTLAPGIGARLHNVLTVFLDGSGAIDSVVNGEGAPVDGSSSGTPLRLVDFPAVPVS